MKALYICDEKEEWQHIRSILNRFFPRLELICVLSGEDAIEYLSYEGPFVMILIEASLRSDHPSELTKKLLPLTGEKPFIFVGAKVHINDRVDEDLYMRSEMNEIVFRPIETNALIGKVQKCLDWAKNEEFEKSIEELEKDELLPMKLRSFYLFNKLPYDVFVELTSTKYVKVISAGKKYLHSDINAYAKKRVKHLYLRKNEYLKFLEDSIEALMIQYESNKSNSNKVMANQIRSALVIQQYVRSVGVTENITKLVDRTILASRNVTLEHKRFKSILKVFPTDKLDLAEQAILTMYLAESMLMVLSWASETSRKKLGLASLLYDSMLEDDELYKIHSLEDPNIEMFTEEQQESYRDHPLRAATIASNFTGYPEADFIIAQHHEKPKGEGFPNKLTTNKLSAHSCIFILANNFVIRYAEQKNRKGAIIDIFRDMKAIYNQGNFKDPIMALQKSII